MKKSKKEIKEKIVRDFWGSFYIKPNQLLTDGELKEYGDDLVVMIGFKSNYQDEQTLNEFLDELFKK